MISELLKRLVYGALVQGARRATGMQVHYRAAYSHDYMHSARWYALRNARLIIDGHRCTHRINLRRCDAMTTLQVHHTSYAFKSASGIGGFLAELSSLRTLCDAHHDKDTGKVGHD